MSVYEDSMISAIYDGMTDVAAWNGVTRRLVEATGSVAGGLYFRSPSGTAHVAAVHNVDPHYDSLYFTRYARTCPLARAAAAHMPGQVRTGAFITRTAAYQASAYFNEWAKPQDWHDVVAVGLSRTDDGIGLLNLWRPRCALEPTAADIGLIREATPHLARALKIRALLERERGLHESLSQAVHRAGFGLALLDAGRRLVFANPCAERILREETGLKLVSGRLRVCSDAENTRLDLALDEGEGGQARGGMLRISRGEGIGPLVGHVVPLGATGGAGLHDVGRAVAAIFLIEPDADFADRGEVFARRYGLTRGEQRMLLEIIRGDGVPAAAEALGVKEVTARVHLTRIFLKTETQRQTELVRLFFQTTLPPRRA
ncbi:MAG: hypothetical protein IIZ63_11780 [Caulobacteraceae bacterium]|nr:hypothetical protein [Caulobacteraceae bacterium]